MTQRTGAAIQAGGRTAEYYTQARPEVANLVPTSCRRVLDVGCGTGQLGALLRERGHEVTGVELVPGACEGARLRLDCVWNLDIEADPLPPDSAFDAIVLADVLEHFIDPWRVLRELVCHLAPGGVVVASVPNVQNGDVIWRLVRGRWDYRERGILDVGHLRFFTLDSITRLFQDAGLRVQEVGHHYRRTWLRELLCHLTLGRARPFFTRQYLLVAERRERGVGAETTARRPRGALVS